MRADVTVGLAARFTGGALYVVRSRAVAVAAVVPVGSSEHQGKERRGYDHPGHDALPSSSSDLKVGVQVVAPDEPPLAATDTARP